MRKPPQPPMLPHAVWINPPKKPSASQDGAGAAISIADDPRVALNGEGLGVPVGGRGRLASRDHDVDRRGSTLNVQRQVSQTH